MGRSGQGNESDEGGYPTHRTARCRARAALSTWPVRRNSADRFVEHQRTDVSGRGGTIRQYLVVVGLEVECVWRPLLRFSAQAIMLFAADEVGRKLRRSKRSANPFARGFAFLLERVERH